MAEASIVSQRGMMRQPVAALFGAPPETILKLASNSPLAGARSGFPVTQWDSASLFRSKVGMPPCAGINCSGPSDGQDGFSPPRPARASNAVGAIAGCPTTGASLGVAPPPAQPACDCIQRRAARPIPRMARHTPLTAQEGNQPRTAARSSRVSAGAWGPPRFSPNAMASISASGPLACPGFASVLASLGCTKFVLYRVESSSWSTTFN